MKKTVMFVMMINLFILQLQISKKLEIEPSTATWFLLILLVLGLIIVFIETVVSLFKRIKKKWRSKDEL